MESIIAYIAKALMLITSMVLYVYLFSTIVPKFIMKLSVKRETTRDRGLKKFVYPTGRCVLYEPELSIRKYINNYVLYTENGYKYIKCKIAVGISRLNYDVYAFNNENKLIDIVGINEIVGEGRYTASVSLPPETSYVSLVLRKANNEYSSNRIIADYSIVRYAICATVVALATAVETGLIYTLVKDIFKNALKLKLEFLSTGGMVIMSLVISLLVAGLTVLAYRRNCKKVINK